MRPTAASMVRPMNVMSMRASTPLTGLAAAGDEQNDASEVSSHVRNIRTRLSLTRAPP